MAAFKKEFRTTGIFSDKKESFLQIKNVYKTFLKTQALHNVNVSFNSGEIHAIVGENGAGKTTLMFILAGICQPDSGTINLDEKEILINSPNKAKEYGIELVPQEISCYDSISISENIFVNDQ